MDSFVFLIIIRPIVVGLGLGLLMKSLILGPKTAGSLPISWMQNAAALLL